MHISLSPTPSGSAVVAAVTGDIDLATAGDLQRDLGQTVGNYTLLVLDLTAVAFIDSSGLRALDLVRQQAVAGGCRLRLAGASKQLVRVLGITRLLESFELYPDANSALVDL